MSRVLTSHRRPGSRRDAKATGELLRLWQQHGDRGARDAIVEEFLPLARRLAGRYANPREPMEDLVQVATVGLLGAIDRFDPDRDTPFVAFAIPTILGELRRYFRHTGWSAHIPRGAQEMALRVDRASQQLTAQTGRAPRVAELAEYLEVSLEDVLLGLEVEAAHHAASLDAPAPGAEPDESPMLADLLSSSEDGFGLVDAKLSFIAAISRLPFQQRRALSLRIEGDMRQVDIARRLGCSQMQISRLLREAGRNLRALTDPELPQPHSARQP
jgi:RNA polymerase sigma-B factor